MNLSMLIEQAHCLATDIMGECENIFSVSDPEDLRVPVDELVKLADRLDKLLLEHQNEKS